MNTVASSTTLYWSTIEAGLGLFAICLPSLQPLARTRSVFTLVDSLRSFVSLRSYPRSHRSDAASSARRSASASRDTDVEAFPEELKGEA